MTGFSLGGKAKHKGSLKDAIRRHSHQMQRMGKEGTSSSNTGHAQLISECEPHLRLSRGIPPWSCCLLEPWPSASWGWRSFSLSLSASVISERWNYELQEKRSKRHIKEFPRGFWIRGLFGLGLLVLGVLFPCWSTWVCFSPKDVDKLERIQGKGNKNDVWLREKENNSL